MSDLFQVRANCIIFSVDINQKQKYVFSLDKDNIVLPYICVSYDNLNDLNLCIINSLKNYFVDDNFNPTNIGIQPQLITHHSNKIESENNTMNLIFGLLVDHYDNIQNGFWIDFQILESTKYHNLFFEVIRNLR